MMLGSTVRVWRVFSAAFVVSPGCKPKQARGALRAFMAASAALALALPSTAAAVTAWPGEMWGASTNLTSLAPADWAGNLSGAYWNPETRRLWVCTNGPAKFWSLRGDGAGGFVVEQAYTGTGDLEGITQVSTAPDRVFVVDEQARTIRAYRVSDGAAVTSWLLDTIPAWGNSGPEGIAFVPDAWLARNNFVDGGGNPYPQSVHGANGFGGILFVAVQTSGWVYAFDLRTDGTHTFVGRYLSSRAESCEMTFDASIGKMYILHNTDGNLLEITDLTSSVSGADRRFNTRTEVQVPSGSNIEGFALTPALTAENAAGDHWCFFTDDSNADGALRWFTQLSPHLEKRDGEGQTAETGSPVAVAPSVAASDPFATPLPDFPVTFAAESGGGFAVDGEAVTDSDGVARVGAWVLGAQPGLNTLTASGAGLGGSPQTFTATGADRTAPTGTVVINSNRSATNSPDVMLTLAWSDGAGSGVARMRFSDDGAHWTVWEAPAATRAYTLPAGDGHKTVRVQYLDRANNRSSVFSDFIRLDTTPPTGGIVINAGALTTTSQNVTLGMTWSDGAGVGVTRMRFSDNGWTWTPWMPPAAKQAHTLPAGAGYHTVRVQYLDGANNYSAVFHDYIKLTP